MADTPFAAVRRTVLTCSGRTSAGRSSLSRRLASSAVQGPSLLPTREPTVMVKVSLVVACTSLARQGQLELPWVTRTRRVRPSISTRSTLKLASRASDGTSAPSPRLRSGTDGVFVEPEGDESALADAVVLIGSSPDEAHATSPVRAGSRSIERHHLDPVMSMGRSLSLGGSRPLRECPHIGLVDHVHNPESERSVIGTTAHSGADPYSCGPLSGVCRALVKDGGMSLTRWPLPDVQAAYCAARVVGDELVGVAFHDVVTPASVMKVQVALTALTEIYEGRLDGSAMVSLDTSNRTAGPVGMSLFEDPVRMSVRDLLVPMMTISDNVATDALIDLVGLEKVNATTQRLDLADTLVASGLKHMLDAMATEAGFSDYAHLARHDPVIDGPPDEEDIRRAVAASSALDPHRGSRTTPADMVRLMQALWTDAIAPTEVCARLRRLMSQQLTRQRLASGFGPGFAVAAKSGGLMGIVRNEVGVVTDPQGMAYAVAVFTRRPITSTVDPAQIDAAIGALAKDLVQQLR